MRDSVNLGVEGKVWGNVGNCWFVWQKIEFNRIDVLSSKAGKIQSQKIIQNVKHARAIGDCELCMANVCFGNRDRVVLKDEIYSSIQTIILLKFGLSVLRSIW